MSALVALVAVFWPFLTPMLPQNLQSLQPDTPIELFELSGFKLSAPAETIRICNHPDVFYRVTPDSDPFEYLAIGVEAEGYDVSGQGSLPQPTMTVSNIGRMLDDWLNSVLRDPDYVIEGTTVTRRITQINYLEGGPDYLSPVRELDQHIYEIEQLSERTTTYLKFILSSSIDLEGEHTGRIALRSCSWRYRDQNTCGYNGSVMFTREGQSTSNPKKDICPGTVAACEIRFPGTYLRHGGFPGLGGL